jgi:hypothetical protein
MPARVGRSCFVTDLIKLRWEAIKKSDVPQTEKKVEFLPWQPLQPPRKKNRMARGQKQEGDPGTGLRSKIPYDLSSLTMSW